MMQLFMLLAFLLMPFQAQAQQPVVVELFTSQSCSSCPPAEKVLAGIAGNERIISIGCHVDYWDHLQWKDTMSLKECSQRQRDYGQTLNKGRVYTPNMIVNGKYSFNGSNAAELERSLRISDTRQGDVASISVTMDEKGFLIALPNLPAGERVPYYLTVLGYTVNKTVNVESGENRGETITSAHPVAVIRELDGWQGIQETRLIKNSDLAVEGLHGVVVLAQQVKGGPIRAAGEYRIYFK